MECAVGRRGTELNFAARVFRCNDSNSVLKQSPSLTFLPRISILEDVWQTRGVIFKRSLPATETSRGFGHTQEATEGQTDNKGSKEVEANVFRGEMFQCETNWR